MTTPYDITYSAMCLWETVLDYCADDDGCGGGSGALNYEVRKAVPAARASIGMAEMRDAVLNLAETCHDEWELALAAGYDGCFDWEWCPKWLDVRVDWSRVPVLRESTIEEMAALYHTGSN